MARMLGRLVWDRIPCSCCNRARTVKVERAREKRQTAREIAEAMAERVSERQRL